MGRFAPLALAALLLAVAAFFVLCARAEDPPAPRGAYAADGRWVGAPVTPRAPRPNLIVFVVDTLRADCLGPSPQQPGDMPRLAALAQRGARLANVSSAASWTLPSLASLLTGQLPDRHRVDQTPQPPVLAEGTTTFVEVLGRGHGYATAAITELHVEQAPQTFLQGFEHIRSGGPLRFARPEIWRWNADRARDRPFFLFLHTYEAHDPYGQANHPWPEVRGPAPPDYELPDPPTLDDAALVERFLLDGRARRTWQDRSFLGVIGRASAYYATGFARAPDRALAARLEQAYREGVRWVDGEVHATIELLEREGLLENTLLLIVGDHGEAFGEHGVINHGRTLHEEHVHVPAVALGPAPFEGGRTLETSLGLVDLIPTFLDLAGLPPLEGVAGRSMLAALRANAPGRAVLGVELLTPLKQGDDDASHQRMFSARTATETYIVRCDMDFLHLEERLYDRASDPGETRNLARAGRLGDAPVSPALAEGIRRARERLWEALEGERDAAVSALRGVRARPLPEPLPAPRVR